MIASMTIKLAPSILAADFAHLADNIQQAENAGADWLHIDVMDGNFVPNISFGTPILKACKQVSSLPLDVHLMIDAPERYLADFAEAGADVITIHAEVSPHLHRSLSHIRELGCKAGLALNPLTPLQVVKDALPYLDLVLIMSVNPGFGGQSFIANALPRMQQVRQWINEDGYDCHVQVDGGVKADNIAACVEAGADVLVAGSAVFKGDIAENMTALRAGIAS